CAKDLRAFYEDDHGLYYTPRLYGLDSW
nr:immunoglobulin heavy chain junction region [Macaca mulatta]